MVWLGIFLMLSTKISNNRSTQCGIPIYMTSYRFTDSSLLSLLFTMMILWMDTKISMRIFPSHSHIQNGGNSMI